MRPWQKGQVVFANAYDPELGKRPVMFTDEFLIRLFSKGGSFYFTSDSLGISVPVPHPLGDYALFEIRYQDIAENIKFRNPVWKDFFPEMD